MFSFGLSLGKPLYVPEGGFKVLEPVNMSMEITDTQSVFLNASNTDSYSIPNLPAWCTLNSATGEITATPDGTDYGQEKFDVVLTNADGSTTITDGLTIKLFRPQNEIDTHLDEFPTTQTDEVMDFQSILTSQVARLFNKENNNWDFWVPFFSSYGNDQQIVLIKKDGTVLENTLEWEDGNIIHNAVTIVAESQDTFMSTAVDKLYRYDSLTGTLSVFFTFPEHGGSYRPLKLGVNRNLISARAYTDATGIKMYEFDDTTGLAGTYSIPNINETPFNVAADNTHVYVTTTIENGVTKLYALDKSDGSWEILLTQTMTSHSYVKQTRYGVYTEVFNDVTYANGYYYLYNGQLTFADDFYNWDSPTIPWPDNYGDSLIAYYYGNINTDTHAPYDTDNSALVPTNSGDSGFLWYEEDAVWYQLTVPNVRILPIPLVRIDDVGTKVVSIADAYSGYTVKDTITLETESYKLLNSSPSVYAIEKVGTDLYIAGYPSGILIKYDSTQPWDNKTDINYNPNTAVPTTNPSFVSYTGNTSTGSAVGGEEEAGHHKVYTMSHNPSDNTLWCFGEWERAGTGLGVTKLELSNNYAETGFRITADMDDYTPKDSCVTDDYIVCTCQRLSDSGVSLVRIDKSDDTFTYYDLPILNYVGSSRIASSDGNSVILITAATSTVDMLVSRIDMNTGTVTTSNTVDGIDTTLDNLDYNMDVKIDIKRLSDGNLYLNYNGTMLTIDDETCLCEVSYQAPTGGRYVEHGDRLYTVDGGTLTNSQSNYLIPDTFSEVVLPTELLSNGTFDTDTVWDKRGTTTISGGEAHLSGAGIWSENIRIQNLVIENTLPTVGETYRVSGEITAWTQGTLRVWVGTDIVGSTSGVGTFDFAIPTDNFTSIALANAGSETICSVDNISIYRVV